MEALPKAREQELLARRDAELLRHALGAARLGVARWELRSGVVEVDAAVEALFGVRSGALSTPAAVVALVHPEDRQALRRTLLAALYQAAPCEVAFRVMRPDGGIRHVQVWSRVWRDEEERPVLHVGLVRDVTESCALEDALRAGEARFRRALEDAPFPVLLHAEDGAVLLLNRSWARLGGWHEAEIPTVHAWVERAGGAEAGAMLQAMGRYALDAPAREGPFRVCSRSGRDRLWELSTVPLGRLPDGRRVVMTAAHDVTEDDRARDLARSNADLEHFAYVASHDLQEPLRSVAGFLNLLERGHGERLDDDARRLVQFASDGARRMQQMIQDLLQYARAGRGPVSDEVAPGEEVLAEALAHLHPALEECGGQVTWSPLPGLRGPRSQLVAVLRNLIGNALKYHREGAAPRVHVAGERRGDRCLLEVRDDGVGIPARDIERIFEPFERLDAGGTARGTGLGLALVRRIVEHHGGYVWVESEAGRGSVFHVALPAPGEDAVKLEPARDRSSRK